MDDRHSGELAAGDEDVRDTVRVLRQLAGPAFQHDAILDFGCGAGRFTIPLARTAKRVVGVSDSPAMLAEARANCGRAGLTNVELVAMQPELAGVAGPFDVVHSHLEFQHIAPHTGYPLVDAILNRVAIRGGGMLHFTYARESVDEQRPVRAARRSGEVVRRLMSFSSRSAATMPPRAVFEYDLGRLFGVLQDKRFDRVATRFTDHGGSRGVKLFFWRGY